MIRHTLQSRLARQSQRSERFARLRARREAAILARPAPEYPPELPFDGEWLAARIRERTVIIHLTRDARHRCDQWAAELDGEVLSTAAGLTALLDDLRHAIGRPASRRTLAGLQHGYTTRDEIDAMAADC